MGTASIAFKGQAGIPPTFYGWGVKSFQAGRLAARCEPKISMLQENEPKRFELFFGEKRQTDECLVKLDFVSHNKWFYHNFWSKIKDPFNDRENKYSNTTTCFLRDLPKGFPTEIAALIPQLRMLHIGRQRPETNEVNAWGLLQSDKQMILAFGWADEQEHDLARIAAACFADLPPDDANIAESFYRWKNSRFNEANQEAHLSLKDYAATKELDGRSAGGFGSGRFG